MSSLSSLSFTWARTEADIGLCQALRHQVFVQEQKVPDEVEIDGKDPTCQHVMCWYQNQGSTTITDTNTATSSSSKPILIATGRVLMITTPASALSSPGPNQKDTIVAQAVLGRIAVHADFRGRGVGTQSDFHA